MKNIYKAELAVLYRSKVFIKALIDLQITSYLLQGQNNVFYLKIAPSKFKVLESDLSNDFKNRQSMTLNDIIGLICVSLNIYLEEYKNICRLNTLFQQLNVIKRLSSELIRVSYQYDMSKLETEHNKVQLNLDVFTNLIKLKGNLESLFDIVNIVRDNLVSKNFITYLFSAVKLTMYIIN